MEEKINGKKIRETQRKSFFEKIFQRTGFTLYQQLFNKRQQMTDTNNLRSA